MGLLFFLLIPVGLYGFYWVYKITMKLIGEKPLIDLPFTSGLGGFEIKENGSYSVWQEGPLFRKTLIDKFRPVITNLDTGQIVTLTSSFLRPHVNRFTRGRMEIFTFYAQKGWHRIELTTGSSISALERALTLPITSFFPDVNPQDYRIQVRNQAHYILIPVLIFLAMISMMFFAGGLVLGINFGIIGIIDFK